MHIWTECGRYQASNSYLCSTTSFPGRLTLAAWLTQVKEFKDEHLSLLNAKLEQAQDVVQQQLVC